MSIPEGFANIGNVCYINSLIQALRHCPQFVRNNAKTNNKTLNLILNSNNISNIYNIIFTKYAHYGFERGIMGDSEEILFAILSDDDTAKDKSKVKGDNYDGEYGLSVTKKYNGICEECNKNTNYNTTEIITLVCLEEYTSRNTLSNLICEGHITRGCINCYDDYNEKQVPKSVPRPQVNLILEDINFKTMCIRFNTIKCKYTENKLFPNMKVMICGREFDIMSIICYYKFHYIAIVKHCGSWFVCNDNNVFTIDQEHIEDYLQTFKLMFIE